MPLAERLWSEAAPLERRVLAHPFVTGLADGALPMESYHFYLRQDHVFLLEYARVLGLAVAAAGEPGDMEFLAGLLHATLHSELRLHRRTCARAGIGPELLAAEEPAPATFAYTRHLLAVARAESLGTIAAALLPCQWGYALIGQALAARGASPVPEYAEWIAAYAHPEYRATAGRLWAITDRLGERMGEDERQRAGAAFHASFRYELLFWEQCWRRQGWE